MVARARRQRCRGGCLTWALPRLAVSDIWAGQLTAAAASLREAGELARAVGQDVVGAFVLSELAVVAALRGDERACRALADEATRAGGRARSRLRALHRQLGAGRARSRARARRRGAAALPGRRADARASDFWDALDRIEAAVRAGELDAARQTLAPFEAWAHSSGAHWARAVASHCRALLAPDPAEAERRFTAALELHAASGRPFERAEPSTRSASSCAAAGAASRRGATCMRRWASSRRWAPASGRSARGDGLRASGQTVRQRDPSTIDDLTAQELQIAHRVAEGHTNRDIAAQMFLSAADDRLPPAQHLPQARDQLRVELVRLMAAR